MKKAILITLLALLVSGILSGCSVSSNVNTNSTNMLKKDLKAMSNSIKNVDVSFMRPQVTINIEMDENPQKETLNNVLEKVKKFTTVNNMDEIANKVGWKDHVWEVVLNVSTGKNKIEYSYLTRYLKSANQSDQSKENIDAYKTWYKNQ